MALLSIAQLRTMSVMPPEDVDGHDPAFVDGRIAYHESRITARLAKRYATPFSAANPPKCVVGWLVDLVTLDCYVRRGFNPSAQQDGLIESAARRADAEVLEAANSETGLFDLPLRADTVGASGVTLGGPLSYSEQSPYVWMDIQAAEGRADDQRGRGS